MSYGYSRRGIIGGSVLQLYFTSYAVRSALLTTATATLLVTVCTDNVWGLQAGDWHGGRGLIGNGRGLTGDWQVVEDGYEFFAKRQLVTLFSAPNYCGEFDNAGAMMSVDETLMCSFQVHVFRGALMILHTYLNSYYVMPGPGELMA